MFASETRFECESQTAVPPATRNRNCKAYAILVSVFACAVLGVGLIAAERSGIVHDSVNTSTGAQSQPGKTLDATKLAFAGFVSPVAAKPAQLRVAASPISPIAMKAPQEAPEKVMDDLLRAGLQAGGFLSNMAGEAKKASENWVNAGWQVKKRAGQVLPEIRPNAADIGERTNSFLADSTEGASPPVTVDVTAINPQSRASSALSTISDSQLQGDFVGFLAVHSNTFVKGSKGEVIFESEQALASMVASFTFEKLRTLAAAARALARYVDDLETELEGSDDQVVEARKEMFSAQRAQKEAERELVSLKASQDSTLAELRKSEAAASAQLEARQQAEREAEAAADRLLQMQQREAAARGRPSLGSQERMELARLEEKLMQAEAAAAEEETRRSRLETSLAAIKEEQAHAEALRKEEEAHAAELEKRAAQVEQEAQRTAEKLENRLSRSRDEVEALQAALSTLQAVKEQQLPTAVSAAAATEPVVVLGGFEAEAAKLQADLQRLAGTAADAGSKNRLPALSSMRKAQLVAECEERGIESKGKVAELRAMLRVERKKDAKVAELDGRGWSDKQARAALAKTNWEVEDAIALLLKKK